MAYLSLVGAGTVVKARKTYALAKCSEKDYPKRSPDIAVTVDGKPATIRVTSSKIYSTTETTGANGYIRLNGYVAWISFDHGFAPKDGLKFTLVEGKAPDANPKREPKAPESEARRVEKYVEWAAGRTRISPVLGGEVVTEV